MPFYRVISDKIDNIVENLSYSLILEWRPGNLRYSFRHTYIQIYKKHCRDLSKILLHTHRNKIKKYLHKILVNTAQNALIHDDLAAILPVYFFT